MLKTESPVRSTLMLAGWRRRAARAPSETSAVFAEFATLCPANAEVLVMCFE
jgi:hypothetical protein